MRNLWPVLVLSGLFLALGCSSQRFSYEVAPTFRTTSYESVAQDPRKDRIVIREGLRPLNPSLHLQAALKELTARHYRTVAAPEADLWVSAFVLARAGGERGKGSNAGPQREGSGEGRHRGGRTGGGSGEAPPGSGAGSKPSGVLVILQLQDRKTGLPVWQGEANLSFQDKAPDGAPLSIEAAVHQLMQALPSRP
jgi:hypothetical protein